MDARAPGELGTTRAPSNFTSTDAASVVACIGVVLCLCSIQGEAFVVCAVIVALIISIILALAAQHLPTFADVPWFSVCHLVFWTVLLWYEYANFRIDSRYLDERVILVHNRCHINSSIFAGAWVVLGFFAGFYPSPARTKLSLFAVACVSIALRLVMLAKAWESAQHDEHAVMHYSSELSLVASLADYLLRAGPSRLSTELLVGGVRCLIGSAFLGLCLGILTRAKLEVQGEVSETRLKGKQQQLDATRHENAELHSQAFELERARRQALVDAKLRERGSRKMGGSRLQHGDLQALDEGVVVDNDDSR